ncbi:MAG: hypothetical protein GY927_03885 [bacterium]|nr:hypothetical protein [bacterium]
MNKRQRAQKMADTLKGKLELDSCTFHVYKKLVRFTMTWGDITATCHITRDVIFSKDHDFTSIVFDTCAEIWIGKLQEKMATGLTNDPKQAKQFIDAVQATQPKGD